MLFDPFEEQFNLPTFPIELRDRQGIKYSIVGYEPINDVGRKVFIYNHSERFRIMFSRLVSGMSDHLITDYSGLQVSRTGAYNSILHVVLCPGDEENSLSVDEIEQTEEIQVTLIYYVNSSRLNIQFVKDLDIMDRSLGQTHENREVTPEVQLGMYLDTAFVFPEGSPRAQLQAHNIKMVTTCEIANSMVPIVPGNTFIEFVFWHCRNKLCENSFPFIHGYNRYDLAIKVNFKSLKILTLVTYLILTLYIVCSKFKRDTSEYRDKYKSNEKA